MAHSTAFVSALVHFLLASRTGSQDGWFRSKPRPSTNPYQIAAAVLAGTQERSAALYSFAFTGMDARHKSGMDTRYKKVASSDKTAKLVRCMARKELVTHGLKRKRNLPEQSQFSSLRRVKVLCAVLEPFRAVF
jgi:hypothetical protein